MAWPFLKPVNLKRFPNYTQIVPRPIGPHSIYAAYLDAIILSFAQIALDLLITNAS